MSVLRGFTVVRYLFLDFFIFIVFENVLQEYACTGVGGCVVMAKAYFGFRGWLGFKLDRLPYVYYGGPLRKHSRG